MVKEIEEDILPGLNKEYEESEDFNLNYLLDETSKLFNERSLTNYATEIQNFVEKGEWEQAINLACNYRPIADSGRQDLELSSEVALERIDKAFDKTTENLIHYPNQLGDFWNDQLVRGAFVVLEGIEKRGKTFQLMEMAVRACRGGRKVAFFQAGDMTEDQQLIRLAIHLSGKSNRKTYCEEHYQPCRDCIKNQLNDCTRKEREPNKFGPFEGVDPNKIRYKLQYKELLKVVRDNEDYRPCYNCKDYFLPQNHWGAVWLKNVPSVSPLTKEEAKKAWAEFFSKKGRQFKLSSHANNTLTVVS